MSVTVHRNLEIEGAVGQPVLIDLYHASHAGPAPTVVFVHGFKGFKDWGGWDLVARAMAHAGITFIKFNFSHNGVTARDLTYHSDLEAFGHNNYSKELDDLEAVLNWTTQGIENLAAEVCDPTRLALVGHSRGGGISLIKASHDPRVKALVTWAAVSALDYAWQAPGFIDQWQHDGVYYVENSRTKQKMPLYYQLYQDFYAHEADYDTAAAMRRLTCPTLIVHGTADAAVRMTAAQQLHAWQPHSKLVFIPDADHTFGMTHPYHEPELPLHTQQLLDATIGFLRETWGE